MIKIPKDVFKKCFDKHIDKNVIYQNVLERGKKNNMSKYVKLSLVPICLLLIAGSIIIFNRNEIFDNEPDISNNNMEVYFNEVSGGLTSIDADVKVVSDIDYPDYDFLDNLVIPNNFIKDGLWVIYTSDSNKGYTILNSYVLKYKENEKSITIAFSKTNEPIRDYFIENGEKLSFINNTKLYLYKYNEMYIANFKYNDIYFDMETNGINESEFMDLLLSIIN